MPPPSKPRRASAERDGTQVDAVPRTETEASVGRGRPGAAGEDPERETGTQAKARTPVSRGGSDAAEDPERRSRTEVKAVPRGRAGGPPTAKNRQSRARPPVDAPGDASGERYQTGNAYADDDGAQSASDYSTGSNYNALDDPNSIGMELTGDGLDALEPELDRSDTQSLRKVDDDEGDDDANATHLGGDDEDDGNETHAGPPLKLEIVEGPGAGKVRKFKGVRMVIGRTAGVDFQLEDQSVSRRHVELIAGDGGVLLRDLGSGNGTKVNGKKVDEKTLEHGDTIAIGKTTLRFVDEVAAFKQAREAAEAKEAAEAAEAQAPEAAEGEGDEGAGPPGAVAAGPKTGVIKSPRGPLTARQRAEAEPKGLAAVLAWPARKKLVYLGGPTGLLLFLLVLFVATRPPPPVPVDPRRKQADQDMQYARDAVKAGKYEEAIGFVESAEKQVPAIDVTGVGKAARAELAVTRALDEARAAIAQNRFQDARAALEGIKEGSLRSEDEKTKLVAALKVAELEYRKQKVTELIVAGDLDAAEQAIGGLPAEEQPSSVEQLRQAREKAAELEAQEKKSQVVGAAAAKRNREAKRAEEIDLAFAVVTRKFSGHEWSRAAAECDRVIDQHPGDEELRKRSKGLQALIPAFGTAYEEGMKKFHAGLLIQAARPLKKARELYGKIGLSSPLGEELGSALSESGIAAGNDALLRDDIASAAVYFREAKRLSPDEPRASQGLEKAIAKAEDLYMFAYGLRDRDPREAVRLFRIVADVTPPGSATHEKAKNLITQMAP